MDDSAEDSGGFFSLHKVRKSARRRSRQSALCGTPSSPCLAVITLSAELPVGAVVGFARRSHAQAAPAKLNNTIRLLSFYQKHEAVRVIMFSKTPAIYRLCRQQGVEVEPDYRHNRYNLPVLRNMLLYAQSVYTSKYYAYINSDILISPDVFAALKITVQLTKKGELRSMVAAFALSLAALHRRQSLRRRHRGRRALLRVDGDCQAVADGYSAKVGAAEHQQRGWRWRRLEP